MTVESDAPAADRVLVVDDNQDLADNVAELLRGRGYDACVVNGVDAADQALSQRTYRLVIADLRMTGGGGLAILGAVKQTCKNAEVILMTANATVDTAIEAVARGAFAYVEKPFSPPQLLSLCERALVQVRLREERLQLQRDLARSEALYREVVDTVTALIFGIDDENIIRMCNAAAAATLGLDRVALCGRHYADFMVSDSACAVFGQAVAEVREADRPTDLELPLLTADKCERIVRFTLFQMDLGRAYDVMTLVVGTDVTDHLELEKRASEAQAMASLATLTAGLAHEVRNPLNAASLQLDLLARQAARLPDAEQGARIAQRVAIVDGELARLTRLLDDFLKLASPQPLATSPVELLPLLKEVHALHDPAAHERQVALTIDCEDLPLVAHGDENMLKQVLVNLVNNALEAVGKDGEVAMRCLTQGRSRVAFEVRDTGPGIPPEIRSDLFTPFVTTKRAGTGLGLTIVKRIVDRHGGTITFSSMAGRGTTVRVVLPRSHRDSEAPPPPPQRKG